MPVPDGVIEDIEATFISLIERLLLKGVACVFIYGITDGQGTGVGSSGNLGDCPARDILIDNMRYELDKLPNPAPLTRT